MIGRALLLVVGCLAVQSSRAENWPQWRGPAFNGSSSETDLPTDWDKTRNVVWRAILPGMSGATPIVWGDSVFVTSPDSKKNLTLLCLDRKTGAVRWQKVVVAEGDREKGRNNSASPSPVTDGTNVYVLFATGDLAAFTMSGEKVWSRNLAAEYGKFANMWIYGSSPVLYEGRLFVQVLQHNPPIYEHAKDDKPQRDSYLLCLDPLTGKNLWRQVRPTDAVSEAQEAYTTPLPVKTSGGLEIIVVGGDYVTAHSAANGTELWRCAGLNMRKEKYWRVVPSPVEAEGTIVACGPKGDPVLGIRDGGKGNVTSTHLAWEYKEHPTDCVTPLYYQGKLYVLDGDRQVMSCLDPKSGAKKWDGKLEVREIFRASPTGADGKIYCISENGTAVVMAAGDEFKVLSTIRMGEAPVRSSIAVAHGQLFIRTAENLYCIEKR